MSVLAHLDAAQAVRHHPVAGRDPQQPCDVAVIMPTILRPSIERAVASIYRQRFDGTIQLMLGIDGGRENMARLDRIVAARPANVAVTVVDPGYSTCLLRGGLHGAFDGGALRTILSYAANSPLLANLDDDNWWGPLHLATLTRAIVGKDWAFSLRWFVAPDARTILHQDIWESRGPGQGTYVERFGGFTDTNTMLIDKTRAEDVLRLWGIPLTGEEETGIGSDRNVFAALRDRPFGATGRASAFYVLEPRDHMYPRRARRILRRLSQGFGGFEAYAGGRFAEAAEGFGRLAAIAGNGSVLHAWHELCRRRAGLGPGMPPVAPCDLPDGDPRRRALAVLLGEDDPGTLAGLDARSAGCLAFFAGARALLAGDVRSASDWLRRCLDVGDPDGRIALTARADLARLEGISAAPAGPTSLP